MKRFIVLAGVAVLLFSCASFPEPESKGDSLVIGNFILDFPDGFFGEPPRKVSSGITLHLVNSTKQTRFTLKTSYPGYFYFLTNGTDEFELESFDYQTQETHTTYTLGKNPINLKIANTPGKVIYLGHLTLSYTRPKIERTYGDRDTSWDFKPAWTAKWDEEGLRQYIGEAGQDSEWLQREVIFYNRTTD
jgi:hypothetical protein